VRFRDFVIVCNELVQWFDADVIAVVHTMLRVAFGNNFLRPSMCKFVQ
jgi:hypothetical protein